MIGSSVGHAAQQADRVARSLDRGGHGAPRGGGPRGSVVFVHAHPDDEAIFTGGTMAQLAGRGYRVVLVVATGGELGTPTDLGTATAWGGPVALATRRRSETEAAARLLGIARVADLGYHDSGMPGDPANGAPGSFWSAGLDEAAGALAAVLTEERAGTVVGYDRGGTYGHPDHVQVHRVTHRAAALAGIATVYDATVDREHLHFVETHLVEEAAGGIGLVPPTPHPDHASSAPGECPAGEGPAGEGPADEGPARDLGLVRSRIGVPTVEVTTTVDVRPWLAVKRAAIAAHASQIPESTSALRLPDHHFAEVYGTEWYVRHGRPGPLDELSAPDLPRGGA